MHSEPQQGATGFPSRRRQRISIWRRYTGAFAPNWLIARKEVSPGAKLTYARLGQYAGREGLCFPKQESLARELGTTARTVRDHLRELKQFGLLESERPGRGLPNRYFFLEHPWMKGGIRLDLPDSSDSERNPSTDLERNESSDPIEKEIQQKEIQAKRKTPTPTPHSFNPPSLEETMQYSEAQNVPQEAARKFFHQNVSVGWVTPRGQPIRDWRAALLAYAESWRQLECRRSPRSSGPAKKRTPLEVLPGAQDFTSTKF